MPRDLLIRILMPIVGLLAVVMFVLPAAWAIIGHYVDGDLSRITWMALASLIVLGIAAGGAAVALSRSHRRPPPQHPEEL